MRSSVSQTIMPSMNTRWLNELEVVRALDNKQIVPYFQPKMCLETDRTLGVEVLARWAHPEKGILFPGLFLSLIEEGELYPRLFSCLLEQGLKLHKCLVSAGQSIVFSYNIEVTQLLDKCFAEQFIGKVKKAGIPLHLITLEMTENSDLALDTVSIENIESLTRNKINLSLDDFGTGFSSIMRLSEIPFNQIKLDSRFVAHSLGFKQSRIIKCVTDLARSLDLEVVAEGVETEKQRAHLQKLGVDSAQGYLFHKPMDGASLLKVLLEGKPQQPFLRQG
ncbi:EAL domain-containing protein [Pseudomonas sp. BGI-2]|uniref:EAL domain-containing protein n=1 Tax=Pseudomonas sp. BGI-2 TaxID=2528211 RepID=UPI001034369A|nr:EAL domain-containing protein [Pseudomonas sp. BGI-2]TBN40719.1 EAL domain-containing protein [Pseudomonas sp. BGI-2]